MSFLVVFLLSASLVSVHTAGGGSLPRTRFVGCFTTTYASSNEAFIQVNPSSWDVCVQLCVMKDTKYVGIEARRSYCYCSNFLVENSNKVDSYSCDYDCYGDPNKSCGGRHKMSVYEIKRSTSYPFSFMVTTGNGVAFLKDKVVDSNVISIPNPTSIRVGYHYKNNEVYYVLYMRQIFRASYVPVLKQFLPPTLVKEEEESVTIGPTGVSVDWVNNKLYYIIMRKNRPFTSKIKETNLDGSYERVMDTELSEERRDLYISTLDPYERRYFVIDTSKVYQYSFKNYTRIAADMFRLMSFGAVSLAVDVHTKTLYVTGTFYGDKKTMVLISSDYDNARFSIIYKQKVTFFILSALSGHLFFKEVASDNSQSLKSFQVSEKDYSVHLTEITQLPRDLGNLTLYHEFAQTPGKKYFCGKKKCSSGCTFSLERSAECTCQQGYRLGADKSTCVALPEITSEESYDDEDDIDDNYYDFDETSKTTINKKKRSRIE